MPATEPSDPGRPSDEPVYEAIGAGRINDPAADEVGNPSQGPDAVRIIVRLALGDVLLVLRSGRFWWRTAAVFIGCFGAGLLLTIVLVTGGDLPPEARGWTYILTAAALVAASCIVATRWAVRPPEAAGGGAAQEDSGGPPDGPFRRWAAASGRGLVFAALSAVFLLVLAFLSGSPPSIAVVAATVILLEFLVFAAVGAGASCWFPRGSGRTVAWGATGLLLLGNVAAVIALLPAVRVVERVVVAINVERDDLGRVVSYDCLPEFRGLAEVYHTERIVWIAAGNPLVLFALLAGESAPREDSLEWLPGELQYAAEGTQVPCIEGEDPGAAVAELPLAAAGITMQVGIGAVFLAGGQMAARRRLEPGG